MHAMASNQWTAHGSRKRRGSTWTNGLQGLSGLAKRKEGLAPTILLLPYALLVVLCCTQCWWCSAARRAAARRNNEARRIAQILARGGQPARFVPEYGMFRTLMCDAWALLAAMVLPLLQLCRALSAHGMQRLQRPPPAPAAAPPQMALQADTRGSGAGGTVTRRRRNRRTTARGEAQQNDAPATPLPVGAVPHDTSEAEPARDASNAMPAAFATAEAAAALPLMDDVAAAADAPAPPLPVPQPPAPQAQALALQLLLPLPPQAAPPPPATLLPLPDAGGDPLECVVCLDARRGGVLQPCGHVVACYERLMKEQQSCPFCRQPVTSFLPCIVPA
jgi:hypothetical protein